MTDQEKLLIDIIKIAVDANNKNAAAIVLESYIAENGFLSDDAGNIVKKILHNDRM